MARPKGLRARRLTWRFAAGPAAHVLVYEPPGTHSEPSAFVLDGSTLDLAWERDARRRGVKVDEATFEVDGHAAVLHRLIRPSGESGWLSAGLMAFLALFGALIVDAINASRSVADPLDVDFRLEVDGRPVPGELLPAQP